MRYAVENRSFISFLFAGTVGLALFCSCPFPLDNPLLRLIALDRPLIHSAIRVAYTIMLFTTPYMISAVALSFAYVFVVNQERKGAAGRLPEYPAPETRPSLTVILGEVHHPKRREAAEHPRWLEIPDRGLF